MKDVIYLLFHLLKTVAKLIRPGGSRTVIAENLLLKQQLIIHSRSRQRAPYLTTQDRTLLGFLSLFLSPQRLARSAVIVKPSTLLHCHNALKSRIIGFAVHVGNVDGPAVCRMFNDANSRQCWPERISSDNDPLFQFHRWKANLRVLEIEEIKSLPHVPMSHPFVERLIGSVRRELLDHTLFWTASDRENKLRNYQAYYNEYRCHAGRDGANPVSSGSRKVVGINSYRWRLEIGIRQRQEFAAPRTTDPFSKI